MSLTAKNITSTGLTIVCTQSGGELTGELQTGSNEGIGTATVVITGIPANGFSGFIIKESV